MRLHRSFKTMSVELAACENDQPNFFVRHPGTRLGPALYKRFPMFLVGPRHAHSSCETTRLVLAIGATHGLDPFSWDSALYTVAQTSHAELTISVRERLADRQGCRSAIRPVRSRKRRPLLIRGQVRIAESSNEYPFATCPGRPDRFSYPPRCGLNFSPSWSKQGSKRL